jgi:nicotinamide phosphoribosyltransferase
MVNKGTKYLYDERKKDFRRLDMTNRGTNNIENFILKGDSYKMTHWLQYPQGTEYIYSYYESRGGAYDKTLFFGLQYILKRHFEGVVVTKEMVDEAEAFCLAHFGTDKYFNRKGWDIIVNEHGGKLPIEIKAVKEGTLVPKRNVLLTVVNTDPRVPFITNFVETVLTEIWYPISVATNSHQIKKIVGKWADTTGGAISPFHLNDFGFRGASTFETAGLGGMAHLVNFMGTDTIAGIQFAMKYYGAKMCGYSVFATEHSTTTIYGRENEYKAFEHFLTVAPDDAIVSIVSDSYNIYDAVKCFGTTLRDKILARKGKLVVRPDSGEPQEVTGKVVEMLWEYFGGTVNKLGFKTLNPKVGIIQGDGIDAEMVDLILENFYRKKFTTDNIVFGSGGALIQKVNRDTHQFAFKCCAAQVNGEWRDVYKEPLDQKANKASKKGRMKLVKGGDGQLTTVRNDDPREDLLVTVYKNGELLVDYTFDEVRAVPALAFA